MPPRRSTRAPAPPVDPDAAAKAAELAGVTGAPAPPAPAEEDPFDDFPPGPDGDDLAPPPRVAPPEPPPDPPRAPRAPRGAPEPPQPPPPAPPPMPTATTPGGPFRASQVLSPQERVRIMSVGRDGKEAYISDYTVQEIAAGGGDVEVFVNRWLAPHYDAVMFRVYRQGARGVQLVQEIPVPQVRAQLPGSPWGAPPWGAPDPLSTQVDAFEKLQRTTEAQRTAARVEARAEQEREERRLNLLLGKIGTGEAGRGGMSEILPLFLLMQTMNRPPAAPRDDGIAADLGAALRELAQGFQAGIAGLEQRVNDRLAMVAMPPPPPPPPGPEAWLPGLLTALRPPPAPDLGTTLATLASAGLFGSRDGPTKTDVELARMEARLAAFTEGAAKGSTLDELGKMVEFVEAIRPASDPWVTVAEKALDKLPELAGMVVGARTAAPPPPAKTQVTHADGRKVAAPADLVRARRVIDGVEPAKSYKHDRYGTVKGPFLVIEAVLAAAKALLGAGEPWRTDTQALFEATMEEKLDDALKALSRIFLRAFGKSEQTTATLRKIAAVWKGNLAEISALLRRRIGAEAPSDVEDAPDGDAPADVEDADEADDEADDLVADILGEEPPETPGTPETPDTSEAALQEDPPPAEPAAPASPPPEPPGPPEDSIDDLLRG